MNRIGQTRIGGLVVLALVIAAASGAVDGEPSRSDAVRGSPGYVGTLLVQLRVSNLEKSVAFYRDVLGFQVKHRNDELRWAKIDIGIPGLSIGIGEGPEVRGSGSTSLNIGVADIEHARQLLTDRGVQFSGPTVTVPGKVRLADFTDLDGNRIRLAQSLEVP